MEGRRRHRRWAGYVGACIFVTQVIAGCSSLRADVHADRPHIPSATNNRQQVLASYSPRPSPSLPKVTIYPSLAVAATPRHTLNRSRRPPTPVDPLDVAPNPPYRYPIHADIWDRLRRGFRLGDLDSKYVAWYERQFTVHPRQLQRMFERARAYLPYIVERVDERGIPLEIALLPAVESAFKPDARSRANAVGMWQFIAATGKRYGLRQDRWYDGRRDVIDATRAALDYLQFLHVRFGGDWFLALAAYNGGEARVKRELSHNRRHGKPQDYTALRLRTETRHYVPKLLAIRNIVAEPSKFGITLPDIPNRSTITVVDTASQVDLSVISMLAHVPLSDVQQLNPGFKRRATPPDGPHRVVIPASHREQLVAGLMTLDPRKRLPWVRHRVIRGDYLYKIARYYAVSVEQIRQANGLSGSLIYAGQDLAIPLAGQTLQPDAVLGTGAATRTPHVHQVGPGDTLGSIAKRYRVHVSQLTQWNSIQPNAHLKLGQRIIVYPN